MLRIVSITRTLPTPDDPVAGTFVANRLAALSRQSALRIVQPVPFFPVAKPLPRWAEGVERRMEGVPIQSVPMFYVPGALKFLDGFWIARSVSGPLTRLRRESPVDLVDAHFGYPDGVGCVRVARSMGLPVFITIRGSETDFLRDKRIGPQLVRALNAATGCISVSHSLRKLVTEYGVDGERVRVIPNAVDRQIFRPGPKQAARQNLGLSPDTRLIVTIGHLIAGKRHHVLVRALAGLCKRHPKAVLAIVGGAAYDRAYPAQLAAIVQELGLQRQVRILGRIPQAQVSTWLQAADLFALATQREGCCNAVLEALAAGRPVITTPVGDNAHFVHPGVNGSLVPVDDVAAFERSLGDALEREWDPEAISRALDVGGWDDVARRVLEFFSERLAYPQQRSMAAVQA
jgi:glycosyltransferase involved in cell wall biosynthesis